MHHAVRLLLAGGSVLAAVLASPVLSPAHAGESDRPRAERQARPADVAGVPSRATVTLTGHGYGHGRGMSQYGAQGAALQGLTAQQIVSFYYPGTQLGTAGGTLRVLLTGDTSDDVVVLAKKSLAVRPVGGTATKLAGGPKRFRLVAAGPGATRVQAWKRGRWKGVRKVPGAAEFVARGVIRLVTPSGVRGYRGALRSAPARGSASTVRDTVNVPTLEQYLRGVVAREIPASWSAGAVQAQAIAARTYAAFERSQPGSYYDICDTTACQVYGGVDDEHPLTDAAIAATAGQVVADAGGPAFTQFSASSGGWTAAGSMPYLTAQADPYDGWDGNPVHQWDRSLTDAAIEAAYPTIGDLQQIEVIERDGNGDWGGRVITARLAGSAGTVTISGDTLRSQFGLRSNWFTFSVSPR